MLCWSVWSSFTKHQKCWSIHRQRSTGSTWCLAVAGHAHNQIECKYYRPMWRRGAQRPLDLDGCTLRCAFVRLHADLRGVYSDTTQLNSTSSWVELCRYKHPFTDDLYVNREVKSRFMTSLTGAKMSDNCGLCIIATLESSKVNTKIWVGDFKYGTFNDKIFTPPQLPPQIPKFCITAKQRLVCFFKYAVPILIDPLVVLSK